MRPLIEPLEGRQLFSAVDLGVLEVRNPVLPSALKVNAKPKGATAVIVQNQGDAKFRGSVTIELQLTPDGQWDDANPALKTVTRKVQALKVDGRRVFRVKLPKIATDVPEGTYRIAARITVTGEDPAATNNNTGAGWKTTFTGTPGVSGPTPNPNPNPNPNPTPEPEPEPEPTPFVDLGIAPSIAETRLEGSTEATLTVVITNHGTADVTERISVDFWAGPNANNTNGDVYLGTAGVSLDLQPGESTIFTKVITAPIEHTGIVYFRAEMYDVDLIDLGDTDRANNQTASGPVEIWHKDVDLSGTWVFDADPTQSVLVVHSNDVVKVRLDVTNNGSETFTGPVSASILALPEGYLLWANQADVTLAAGETQSFVVEFTVASALPLGDHPLQGRLTLHYNEGPDGNDNNDLPDGLTIRIE